MAFLHKSDIKSHGQLKSENCMVDSRLVLTITDYGLPTLRELHRRAIGTSNGSSGCRKYSTETCLSMCSCKYQFYVAPEILRRSAAPVQGTQSGDVYSFAIILQEFFTRKGPYSENQESGQGGGSSVFRMSLNPYCHTQLSRAGIRCNHSEVWTSLPCYTLTTKTKHCGDHTILRYLYFPFPSHSLSPPWSPFLWPLTPKQVKTSWFVCDLGHWLTLSNILARLATV